MNMLGVEPGAFFSEKIEKGWVGAPVIKTGELADHPRLFLGAQAGWILNHKLTLGGKGYFTLNPLLSGNPDEFSAGFACLGIQTEYLLSSYRNFSVTLENMIGAGNFYTSLTHEAGQHESTADLCFILEPGIKMNLNLFQNLQLSAGVDYRFINGMNHPENSKNDGFQQQNFKNFTDADIEGWSFQLEIRLGKF